jgi:hypothetical protein
MWVDLTRFESLLRRVARQTTRRAALANQLGGALLLRESASSEATLEAKRRKHHHRHNDRQARAASTRLMAIQVDNTQGTNPISVLHGTAINSTSRKCCQIVTTVQIPAGESRLFQNDGSGQITGFVFINNRYWFQFKNPGIGRPFAQIALDGAFDYRPPISRVTCCFSFPVGQTVERFRTFKEGDTLTYNIQNTALFTVRRQADLPRHKLFTVTPPPTL